MTLPNGQQLCNLLTRCPGTVTTSSEKLSRMWIHTTTFVPCASAIWKSLFGFYCRQMHPVHIKFLLYLIKSLYIESSSVSHHVISISHCVTSTSHHVACSSLPNFLQRFCICCLATVCLACLFLFLQIFSGQPL